ncbi:MAG: hypothetical protein M1823_004314 [Watsoniomyces obsoletus]|nr:MAG: hypothetical protein M1823_004314 [Watsoniomyces obsoletus]
MPIFGAKNSKPKRLQRPPDPVLAQIAALPPQGPPPQRPLPTHSHTVPCWPPPQKLVPHTPVPPVVYPGRSASRPHAQRPQGVQCHQQYHPAPPRPPHGPGTASRPVATPPATSGGNALCAHARASLVQSLQLKNVDAQLCRLIASKLDSVLSLIDCDQFNGEEHELVVSQPALEIRGGGSRGVTKEVSRRADHAISSAITSTNYFCKANLYANSRLPPYLPPLKFYLSTYPLLCLAAQYSQRVYTKPAGSERHTHVEPDWRLGTKAMVLKSVPIDHMDVVVFAIRGSQTFMDWAVNLNSAPAAPTDFLDDPGNLCHSGFLSVARKMVKPVAARLRGLLEEDPSRAGSSLLITGHSAGGAVASLLYAHMVSRTVESELNILTGVFKRVHCVTFGTPPISLLPLNKPSDPRLHKSLFYSFINEGDPVPRADKPYMRSLLNLYSSPAPRTSGPSSPQQPNKPTPAGLWKRPKPQKAITEAPRARAIWPVPPCALSNAGELVLLRNTVANNPSSSVEDSVVACTTSDQQLRGIVFGDPVMHMMKLYASRIETLATNAVLAKGPE